MAPQPTSEAPAPNVLETCIELANAAHTRFQQRREIEWKVSIGAWTLIAAAAVFAGDHPPNRTTLLGALLALLAYVWWITAIWRSNASDKSARNYYLFAADSLMRDPARPISPRRREDYPYDFPWYGAFRDGSIFGQIMVTIGLLICAVSMVASAPDRTASTRQILQSLTESASRLATAADVAARAAQTPSPNAAESVPKKK